MIGTKFNQLSKLAISPSLQAKNDRQGFRVVVYQFYLGQFCDDLGFLLGGENWFLASSFGCGGRI